MQRGQRRRGALELRAGRARGRSARAAPAGVAATARLRQADDQDGHSAAAARSTGPAHRRSGSQTGDGLRRVCLNRTSLAGGRYEGAQPQRHPLDVEPASVPSELARSLRAALSLPRTLLPFHGRIHASGRSGHVRTHSRGPRTGREVHPRAVRLRGRGRRGRARARHARGASRWTPRWPSSTPGCKQPSVEWRRRFSLLLGLERLLGEEEPHLVDGTVLSAHQVDALSGTLTALLAEAQRNGNGHANGAARRGRRRARPRRHPRRGGRGRRGRGRARGAAGLEPRRRRGRRRPARGAARGPQRGQALLVRARHGRRQDGRRARLRRGLAHRRRADPHPPPQPRRPVPRRAARPRLRQADLARRCSATRTRATARSRSRPTSGSSATRARSPTPTRSSSATRRTPRWARRPPASIRQWSGPIFVGMTATGALIARHVTDLFPTQTSRFDLAQAARRGVIAPLRCVRIPPGPGRAHDRQGAAAPRRGGHRVRPGDAGRAAGPAAVQPRRSPTSTRRASTACPASSTPPACATPTTSPRRSATSGMKAQAVSGETPKRELAEILARYERGDVDVLVNAQLLAEGWNSPRATVCMHLAPTASKRIYQQRVGRVTRRQPGKEAGIVVDFVHPATKHDDPVVTLHSLLDRDVYRGGAIVVGPVRRGRGRRLRVERRVLPVTADENRRIEVFERELWRIAVEHLDYGEQVQWAALAGARVAPDGLAPGAGDAALRPGRRAQAHVPADRGRAQQEPAAAPARAAGDRRLQGRRGVRPRAGLRRGLAARRQARGRQGRAAGAGREEDRPPRPGQQLDLALREPHARGARGVRRPALAGDQAAARAARELLRRRARPQRPPARARRAPAGPAAVAPRCSPPRCRTPPRPARSSTAPGRGCRASPPRWPASCCATSRRARASAPRGGAARRARRRAPRRGGRDGRRRRGGAGTDRGGRRGRGRAAARGAEAPARAAAPPRTPTPTPIEAAPPPRRSPWPSRRPSAEEKPKPSAPRAGARRQKPARGRGRRRAEAKRRKPRSRPASAQARRGAGGRRPPQRRPPKPKPATPKRAPAPKKPRPQAPPRSGQAAPRSRPASPPRTARAPRRRRAPSPLEAASERVRAAVEGAAGDERPRPATWPARRACRRARPVRPASVRRRRRVARGADAAARPPRAAAARRAVRAAARHRVDADATKTIARRARIALAAKPSVSADVDPDRAALSRPRACRRCARSRCAVDRVATLIVPRRPARAGCAITEHDWRLARRAGRPRRRSARAGCSAADARGGARRVLGRSIEALGPLGSRELARALAERGRLEPAFALLDAAIGSPALLAARRRRPPGRVRAWFRLAAPRLGGRVRERRARAALAAAAGHSRRALPRPVGVARRRPPRLLRLPPRDRAAQRPADRPQGHRAVACASAPRATSIDDLFVDPRKMG